MIVRPVHARQQLGAGRAVAVLARQRAAVRDGEVGARPRGTPRKSAMPGRGEQVEVDPHVQAAVAEVPVVGAARPCRAAARRTPAGRRRTARAAPRRPPSRGQASPPSGSRVSDAGAVLADPPQRPLRRLGRRRAAAIAYGCTAAATASARGVRLGPGRPAGLHVQPAAALGQRAATRSPTGPRAAAPRSARRPSPRRSAGRSAQHDGHVRRRRRTRRGSRARPARARRATRPAGPSPRSARRSVPSLPTSARARSTPCSGQQLVEVVAGDAAGEVGEAGAQHVAGDPLAERRAAPSRRAGRRTRRARATAAPRGR